MIVNAYELARILDEEFSEDSWGTIDPSWFLLENDSEYTEEMYEVLNRCAVRINELVTRKLVDSMDEE